MGKFQQFLTVICPLHDSGGILLFHIFIMTQTSKKLPNFEEVERASWQLYARHMIVVAYYCFTF